MTEMTDFPVDSSVPMTGRTIAAGVAKIPPAIIVAAAALGAYQAAPVLVEYFKPGRPLYMSATPVKPLAPPVVKPVITPAPEPVSEPVQKHLTTPAAPPVVRQEEATAAPVVVVEPPRAATLAAPTDVPARPAVRGQILRGRPPRLQFSQGLSGLRGMARFGHVVRMLHFARRFHR
jgi:hypothetical protein